MTTLQNIANLLIGCNMHFCLYGAFGVTLVIRAILDWQEGHYDKARERATHGVVYCSLAFL